MGRERLRPLSGPSHVGKRALPVRLWSAPAFRICRLERDPTYFGRQALSTGAYGLSQRWSRALWIHPDRPDGILYCSRFNLSLQCIAVFDRAGAGISWEDLGPLLDIRNRIFLGDMLARYDFALL